MPEEKKQRLKEYQRNYRENIKETIVRLKKQHIFFICIFFSLYKNEKRIGLQNQE